MSAICKSIYIRSIYIMKINIFKSIRVSRYKQVNICKSICVSHILTYKWVYVSQCMYVNIMRVQYSM